MRIRIDLAYDGSDFRGWAIQPGLRTVQGELEGALAMILRLTTPPTVTVAGRTDAGVHARGQVTHVDFVPRSEGGPAVHPGVLERRLRKLMPEDIRIQSVTEAPDGFDARFAALERRYIYRMTDNVAGPDPLSRGMIVKHGKPLDVRLMNEAAEHLLGEHDFASFCRQREGATTIRTLLALKTIRGGQTIATTVRADAFCHSMVRSLMGCLVAIGERRFAPEFAAEVLAGRQREPRIQVMPAHGLVLEEVVYPPDDQMAARVLESRRRRGES